MILIYTTDITPRISFVSKFVFTQILNVVCKLTSNIELFNNYDGAKLNYSNIKTEGVSIKPQSLLFEKGIRTFTPNTGLVDNMPVLFPVSDSPTLSFDIFAATFYMITRYEEYLPQLLDKHGRTFATESVAYKNGFLHKPVVDIWSIWLRDIIKEHYPEFMFPERKYCLVPTIDVDIAYAYKCRGFVRTMGATAKAVLSGNWTDSMHRFRTLVLDKTDPYDTFELMRKWFTKFELQPKFFFLVGKYGSYDKNISAEHPAMQQLIFDTSKYADIGIHPSYHSNVRVQELQSEIASISQIINKKVTISRQHFLKLRFPETYKQLIDNGITHDYTMGYADLPGFRAGTCTPFHFYDLSTETETDFTINPFQVMDGTLNQYMKLSVNEALEQCKNIITEVKQVKGTFIPLWHNESLSEMREWKGWREAYFKLLQMAV